MNPQSDAVEARYTIHLNGTWHFLLAQQAEEHTEHSGHSESRNTKQWCPPHPEDALWNTIQVPGSWEEQGYGQAPGYARIDTWTKIREYEGSAWYARDVFIPADTRSGHYVFGLKGVRWTSRLWFNGNEAGIRDSLLTEQTWDITPWVKPGENNRIEIWVDNTMKAPLAGSHIHSLHTAAAWGALQEEHFWKGGLYGGYITYELSLTWPAERYRFSARSADPLKSPHHGCGCGLISSTRMEHG